MGYVWCRGFSFIIANFSLKVTFVIGGVECTYTQVFTFNIIVNGKRNPGTHQNIMSPAGSQLLCTMKGIRPRQGAEKVDIDQFLGQLPRDRLTGKLLPGCLANTRQAPLANEGLHPVHWG